MNAPLDPDSAPDSDAQLPRWFGDYVLLKRLGRGGMGTVYLARSRGIAGIDRLCVIKTLRSQWTNDREYVARFVDEARVVVHLNHRNICPVFDVGQVKTTYYLAMDFVPGRDLQAVLECCHRLGVVLPLDLSLLVIAEVLDALDAAHRLRDPQSDALLNLVHRDVSPHNVLVSFDGDVKLIDFGLAQSSLKQEHTEPGIVLGKLAYMAPEHARGEPVDLRSDLFAVGVMLYELAAGERYWEGRSVQQIWQEVGRGGHVPARLRTLPVDVQRVIERATSAMPRERFKSGAEMRAALGAVQLARGVLATSAELRTQLEALFDGEAQADRRERAALLSLPLPAHNPAAGASTRLARAPGAAQVESRLAPSLDVAATARTQVAPSDPLLPTESEEATTLPTANPAPATLALPSSEDEDAATVVTRAPHRDAPSPQATTAQATPEAKSRSFLPFALVGGVVFGAVAFALLTVDRGGAADAVVTAPRSADAGIAVADAGIAVAVAAAPVTDAGSPDDVAVERPAITDTPKPTKKTPKPTSEPWPATFPRLVDKKQALLRARCGALPCARTLVDANPAVVDAAGMMALQTELTQCLTLCKKLAPGAP